MTLWSIKNLRAYIMQPEVPRVRPRPL